MAEELFNFYLAHQDELVKEYNGKYLVITKNGVEGALEGPDDNAAYRYGVNHFGLGNFIIQKCTPGKEAYTDSNYFFRF